MTDQATPKTTNSDPMPIEDRSFHDILKALAGKTVTIVNPESYEDAPIGHQIRAGFYSARITGLGRDYITFLAEFQHQGKDKSTEPVKSIIPIDKIKRIGLMKGVRLIHL